MNSGRTGSGPETLTCPFRVKVRRTRYQYMSSALHLNSDIARRSRYFAFVPFTELMRCGKE